MYCCIDCRKCGGVRPVSTQSIQECVSRAPNCAYPEQPTVSTPSTPYEGPLRVPAAAWRARRRRGASPKKRRAPSARSPTARCVLAVPPRVLTVPLTAHTHSTPVSTHSTHCEYSDHPLLVLRVPTVSTNRRSGLSTRKVTERQLPIRSVTAVLIHNGRSDP